MSVSSCLECVLDHNVSFSMFWSKKFRSTDQEKNEEWVFLDEVATPGKNGDNFPCAQIAEFGDKIAPLTRLCTIIRPIILSY